MRCPDCQFRIRGTNHTEGQHHAGHAGKVRLVSRPNKRREATPPKSAGQGYDFSAVKVGRAVSKPVRRIEE